MTCDAMMRMERTPYEAIGKILTEVMDIAAANGADSRSMPDEYVEVAAWLCGIPSTLPTSNIPEGWKLVPTKPTQEMLEAGQTEWLDSGGADPSFDVYRAMLAAAPEVKP